ISIPGAAIEVSSAKVFATKRPGTAILSIPADVFSSCTGLLLRQAGGFAPVFSAWPRRGRGRLRAGGPSAGPISAGPVAVGAAHHPISAASRFAHSQEGLFESRVQGMGNIVAAFALGMPFALSVTSGADLLREDDRKWILWLCVFAPLAVLGLIAQLIDYRKKRRE